MAIRTSLILTSLLLVSCSSHYEVNTNLDPQNFENYFKPSQVQLVNPNELPADYKTINAVEGQSCQAKENDKPASDMDAINQARIAAADLEANGLVVDVCESQLNTEYPECLELITCYARAISLPDSDKNP